MNDLCPCCFRELPNNDGLVIDLDGNFLIYNGHCIELTPIQAEILHVLWKAAPQWRSIESIISAVYGHNDGPQPECLRVHISDIRRKIAHIPVRIETIGQGRRGNGNYRLVYHNKGTDDGMV